MLLPPSFSFCLVRSLERRPRTALARRRRFGSLGWPAALRLRWPFLVPSAWLHWRAGVRCWPLAGGRRAGFILCDRAVGFGAKLAQAQAARTIVPAALRTRNKMSEQSERIWRTPFGAAPNSLEEAAGCTAAEERVSSERGGGASDGGSGRGSSNSRSGGGIASLCWRRRRCDGTQAERIGWPAPAQRPTPL